MRRSLHFVPGGQERMIAKALTLPADGLILDLEDAVPPSLKPATRPIVRRWLETLDFGGRERWVRMNPIFTEHAVPDLEETITARPDGYLVPKPRSAADVRQVAQSLERLEEKHGIPFGSTKLILIATETPRGLLSIGEVAAASPRITAISWGIEDLGAAMGLPRVRDESGRYLDIPRHARVMCAVAASAAGVEWIDTVYTDIPDLEGLRRECKDGVAMGFSGKMSIHPSQIEVINQEFTPSKADAEEALALIAAFEEHARKGAGAFAWKGQMMDQPHLTRAQKIAERARRAGVI
ncbi:MAG TPA: CoA ester lyase [Verrucomicrobiae bacterium]|nr:CoA ester lyase [Verrucomicrobiae bacterium]